MWTSNLPPPTPFFLTQRVAPWINCVVTAMVLAMVQNKELQVDRQCLTLTSQHSQRSC